MAKKKAKTIWLVGTECGPGKEKEFNQWYDTTHAPLALKVPGIIGATRYERVENEVHYPRYLAIYGLEGESVVGKLAKGEGMEALVKDAENMPKFGARPVFLVHYKQIG